MPVINIQPGDSVGMFYSKQFPIKTFNTSDKPKDSLRWDINVWWKITLLKLDSFTKELVVSPQKDLSF